MPETHGGRQPIPIIYEDQACVVFNKPPGLLVVPADDKQTTTLTDIVNKQFSSRNTASDDQNPDQFRLHPCHRLDKIGRAHV